MILENESDPQCIRPELTLKARAEQGACLLGGEVGASSRKVAHCPSFIWVDQHCNAEYRQMERNKGKGRESFWSQDTVHLWVACLLQSISFDQRTVWEVKTHPGMQAYNV